MQDTPKADRLHIAIFGRRNAGKSSLINALTGQDTALVSALPGTTTDPVSKAMEIAPIGPCIIIDTAGIDDEGQLGELRVRKSKEILNQADLALLVIDPHLGVSELDRKLKREIKDREIGLIGVLSKTDQGTADKKSLERQIGLPLIAVSSHTREGIDLLIQQIIKQASPDFAKARIVGDIIEPGDICLLVVPIDTAAPKGRLILPQVQTIRDILDNDATAIMVKVDKLRETLEALKQKPRLVITDSQVFGKVAALTPDDIMLTSFSILFARYKGDLRELVLGAKAIDSLHPGDSVLIAEACTHHAQDDDIGKVQIPRCLNRYVGGDLNFTWFSGSGYPENLGQFKLVIHCGACMINRRQMIHRIGLARESGVAIVNYGVLLAFLNGILPRALQAFPQTESILRGE